MAKKKPVTKKVVKKAKKVEKVEEVVEEVKPTQDAFGNPIRA